MQFKVTSKKPFIIALFTLALLLLIAVPSFSLDLSKLDGHDWISFSYEAKIYFLTGYVVGAYATQDMLLSLGFLTETEYLEIRDFLLNNKKTGEILEEIDNFYSITSCYDYPIYIVVYIRNIWKKDITLIPWKELKE